MLGLDVAVFLGHLLHIASIFQFFLTNKKLCEGLSLVWIKPDGLNHNINFPVAADLALNES